MKQDFMLAKEELGRIGIIRVATDFYSEPKRKGSCYFVKSPVTHDKTASLALYPTSNRFTDFANGGVSGDCIAFVAYVRGCNQWEALRELRAFYGLSDNREQDKQEAKRRIQLQQQEERKRRERQQEFKVALYGAIEQLKQWAVVYSTAKEKNLYEPFSNMWTYYMEELQTIDYKLDILCAADCKAYPRLKPYHENLPSDRLQWLLDVLEVLQGQGAFTATKAEKEEIIAQRDFELTRQPGAERRCIVEW